MSIKFKITKDFSHRGTTSFDLKKNAEITEDKLSKKFGSKEILDYMLSCTNFKDCVKIVEFKAPEIGVQEYSDDTFFLINEDIKKKANSKKVIFNKEEVVCILDLKEALGDKKVAKLILDQIISKAEKIEEAQEDMMFLAQEDFLVNDIVIIKKDDKISLSELSKQFTNEELSQFINDKKLMEIKVSV